ncbi:uncharacterized protein [Gossypium hirsutum]|uniref:Uncharacterized protein n=1 Tax=Gossypium hirsutum TaxID=3635 RepID=A0A1U8NWJ3_GOSHI|nr:uncharacterized protein LOC107952497 [Gossypium hirsutum]
MRTRGTCGRGIRGCDRGRGSARAGSSASGHMPNVAPASPVSETGSYGRAAGDKGDKIVAGYEAEFLRLSRYARGMVATDYKRCVHFEYDLQDELRILIAPQRERDFAVLVEKEKITEDVKRSEGQNHEKKRGRSRKDPEPSSSFSRPKKKARLNGPVQIVGDSIRVSVGRGLWHASGASQWSILSKIVHRGLYKCKLQPALVYAAHHRENGDAPDVIIGMFFIRNKPYTALIDVGSMHSYIGCTVSGTLGILCKSIASEMTMVSPLGQTVRVNKLFRDVPLEVQGVTFAANLVELPFGEFDLILGMDWLVKHRASLDCATKRVVLKTTKDEKVVVIGELRDYLSNVVFALRAKKLVHKGCEVFLAYIGVSDSEAPTVENIRIVKDFLNVFLDELPGLPPHREAEFGIELLPRTALVSIALIDWS